MKICDVVQFYSPLSGGVKRYIHYKIKCFSELNDIEHVVIVPAQKDELTYKQKSKVYNIASPPLIGSKSYRLLISKDKIIDIIDRERPDIIEVGDPYFSAWIAIEAGKLFKIPVVGFYHSDYPRAITKTFKKYIKFLIDQVLEKLINEYLKELYNNMVLTIVPTKKYMEILSNIGIENVTYLPLGYDSSIFNPKNSRPEVYKELNLTDDTYLLLYVGRMAREKNIKSLFSMMHHLNHLTSRKYHLLLIGDGELNRWIERNIVKFNNITWYHYFDDGERLSRYYSAADLFVHAGHAETFGLVAVEAMACGTRVLGIRNGGLDEVLEIDDKNAFSDTTDGIDLAKKVIEVTDVRETMEDRIKRSQRIKETFDFSFTFEKLIQIYKKAIDVYNKKFELFPN